MSFQGFLKQSTAVDVILGPFVDSTDGDTEEIGLTIAQADVRLSKNGQTGAQKNDVTSCVHDADGFYNCELDTTDTNTVGQLTIYVHVAGALCVRMDYHIVEEAVYDAMYGGSAEGPLQATVAGNTLDVTATGAAGIDWGNIENVDTVVDLSETTISNVNGISSLSGATLNFANEGDNVSSAIKSVSFVGVETSGTNASVDAEDGVYHNIDDTGNAIDIVYQFDIGGARSATAVLFVGYLNGSNDTIDVQAYNGTTWDTRKVIAGQAGTTNIVEEVTLLNTHTGTGADLGKVFIRLVCTAKSNPSLFTDELLVQAVSVSQSVGYADGAVWVDTNASNTNTESFVDGVADNPVSTLAAALTIRGNVGIKRIRLISGSSITIASTQTNCEFMGENWSLALGGQSLTDCHIIGASLSGTATGSSTIFERCIVDSAITIPPTTMRSCYFGDTTITAGSAGNFFFNDCRSRVAGTGSVNFDFGSALNSSGLSMRNYSGGVEIENMGAGTGTYTMSLEGNGALTINANCSATSSVALRGNFKLTDNAAGAVTVIPTVPTIDQVNQGVAQASTGNTVTLAADASAVNGQYDPGVILIITGTGAGQSRSILDYDGTTKIAVVNKDWRVNPDTTSSYIVTTNSGQPHVNEGLAQAGAASTITLNTLGSATDDIYIGQSIFLVAGTGQDQARVVTDYNGTTKVATVHRAWDVQPDATTSYIMLPLPTMGDSIANIETAVSDIQGAGFNTSTDSLEAIRDRGDAAWTTGAGGTNPVVLQNTTIATLASQTSFTLTAGSTDDDAYNGMVAVVTDQSTSTQKAVGKVSDYVGSTKTITLIADPAIFTMAIGDTIDILAVNDRVTLVDTTTTNTDMRGTDNAALASVCTEARLSELDPTNLPLDISLVPTSAEITDDVWDELLSGHVISGSAGEALTAAGTAGDPWTTTLPGSYTGSQAGKMLSDVLTDTADLQANQGNWLTATGFSTHDAAAVWTSGTRTLTSAASGDITSINGVAITAQMGTGFAYYFNVVSPAQTMNDVGSGGGGDASEAKQDQILGLLTTSVVQSNSDPSKLGYVSAYKDADYDGVAHEKKVWSVPSTLIDLTTFTDTKEFEIKVKSTGVVAVTISGTDVDIVDPNGAGQAVHVGWDNAELTSLSRGKQYDYELRVQTSGGLIFIVDAGSFKVLN